MFAHVINRNTSDGTDKTSGGRRQRRCVAEIGQVRNILDGR
jgi:hypothetical protein